MEAVAEVVAGEAKAVGAGAAAEGVAAAPSAGTRSPHPNHTDAWEPLARRATVQTTPWTFEEEEGPAVDRQTQKGTTSRAGGGPSAAEEGAG